MARALARQVPESSAHRLFLQASGDPVGRIAEAIADWSPAEQRQFVPRVRPFLKGREKVWLDTIAQNSTHTDLSTVLTVIMEQRLPELDPEPFFSPLAEVHELGFDGAFSQVFESHQRIFERLQAGVERMERFRTLAFGESGSVMELVGTIADEDASRVIPKLVALLSPGEAPYENLTLLTKLLENENGPEGQRSKDLALSLLEGPTSQLNIPLLSSNLDAAAVRALEALGPESTGLVLEAAAETAAQEIPEDVFQERLGTWREMSDSQNTGFDDNWQSIIIEHWQTVNGQVSWESHEIPNRQPLRQNQKKARSLRWLHQALADRPGDLAQLAVEHLTQAQSAPSDQAQILVCSKALRRGVKGELREQIPSLFEEPDVGKLLLFLHHNAPGSHEVIDELYLGYETEGEELASLLFVGLAVSADQTRFWEGALKALGIERDPSSRLFGRIPDIYLPWEEFAPKTMAEIARLKSEHENKTTEIEFQENVVVVGDQVLEFDEH